jgi:ABC-type lipoprotein export system ATPase subunit
LEQALISLQHVSRIFDGGRVVALRDINLDIRPGEWLTILGPSGSGKSTLLNLLCGLDQPTRGEIFFNGQKPRSPSVWASLRAKHIGYIFQSFNLLPSFTAIENIQMPLFGMGLTRACRLQRAVDLLNEVGLNDRENHLPGDLSGGEKQRVAIARSLVNNPSLLLADEPTGNLDSQNSAEIMALLKKIHHSLSLTMVLVTHNATLASLGDRWLYMLDGLVSQTGANGERPPCIL